MMAPGTKRWYNVVRDNVVAWNAEKQREREKVRERERERALSKRCPKAYCLYR